MAEKTNPAARELLEMRFADFQHSDRTAWRYGDIETAHGEWRQTGGDVTAHVFGATFARVNTDTDTPSGKVRKWVEMVKVGNMEVDDSDYTAGADGPYYVETFDLTPWSMFTQQGTDFFNMFSTIMEGREVDNSPWYDMSADELLLMFAERWTSNYGYNDTYRGQYATLGAAMSAYDVPVSALWRPDEATARVQWGKVCKVTGNEQIFPRDNHMAVLAVLLMHGRAMDWRPDALAEVLTHIRQVAQKMEDEGAELPAWYRDNPNPCDAWGDLERF